MDVQTHDALCKIADTLSSISKVLDSIHARLDAHENVMRYLRQDIYTNSVKGTPGFGHGTLADPAMISDADATK